jgi:DNA-binding NtrC family response regulator
MCDSDISQTSLNQMKNPTEHSMPGTPDSGSPSPLGRVLVADDDPFIRELHSLVLTANGFQVATAVDGADAILKLAAERFDLVLTDRQMPNLDGASLVLLMRNAGIRIPVVMVSGSLTLSPLPPEIAREVSAAIPKPARTAELLAAVAHALRHAANQESELHHGREHHRAA